MAQNPMFFFLLYPILFVTTTEKNGELTTQLMYKYFITHTYKTHNTKTKQHNTNKHKYKYKYALPNIYTYTLMLLSGELFLFLSILSYTVHCIYELQMQIKTELKQSDITFIRKIKTQISIVYF